MSHRLPNGVILYGARDLHFTLFFFFFFLLFRSNFREAGKASPSIVIFREISGNFASPVSEAGSIPQLEVTVRVNKGNYFRYQVRFRGRGVTRTREKNNNTSRVRRPFLAHETNSSARNFSPIKSRPIVRFVRFPRMRKPRCIRIDK